jgi:acyl dehydratase
MGNALNVHIGAGALFRKTVTESDAYLCAGITGDFSSNHVDEEYMRAGRYGRPIAQGALTIGFLSAASARRVIERSVSLGYDRVRFTAPVYFGNTIETVYKFRDYDPQKKRITSEVTCRNQRGENVAAAVHLRSVVDRDVPLNCTSKSYSNEAQLKIAEFVGR